MDILKKNPFYEAKSIMFHSQRLNITVVVFAMAAGIDTLYTLGAPQFHK